MKWTRLAVFAAWLALSGQAFAQAQYSGFYLGGSVGEAESRDWCAGVTVSCDDRDSTWRAFGGYQINRVFAVELGYADLGEVTIGGPTIRASAEATAWDLVGIAAIPLGPFSIYGKLGAYYGELEASSTATLFGFTSTGTRSKTGTELTYGLGLRLDLGRNLALRGEWQRYLDIGDESIRGETDIDVVNVGLMIRF